MSAVSKRVHQDLLAALEKIEDLTRMAAKHIGQLHVAYMEGYDRGVIEGRSQEHLAQSARNMNAIINDVALEHGIISRQEIDASHHLGVVNG